MSTNGKNGKNPNSTIATILLMILSKEGLVSMLLTVMICSNLYDTYRGRSIQIELNHAIKTRMLDQTSHEKVELELAEDIIKAIEGLEFK